MSHVLTFQHGAASVVSLPDPFWPYTREKCTSREDFKACNQFLLHNMWSITSISGPCLDGGLHPCLHVFPAGGWGRVLMLFIMRCFTPGVDHAFLELRFGVLLYIFAVLVVTDFCVRNFLKSTYCSSILWWNFIFTTRILRARCVRPDLVHRTSHTLMSHTYTIVHKISRLEGDMGGFPWSFQFGRSCPGKSCCTQQRDKRKARKTKMGMLLLLRGFQAMMQRM